MRLEKACYYIKDIHYGSKTKLKDHTLILYKEALRDLVVGGTEFRKLERSPSERLKVTYSMIPGATSQIGNNKLTTICY